MINLTTDRTERVIKITDDWCDENSIRKIQRIMNRLYLDDAALVDWEIKVREEIYPTEESMSLSNELGDECSERDRYITTTVKEEDGSESIMTWDETLELEIREGGVWITLDMLFIRR